MNEILLLLSSIYVFLAALLLFSLIHSKFHWMFKVAMIFAVTMFYFVSYYSWSEAQGWPTNQNPPKRFVLHHALVKEPDQDAKTEGEIFIWLSDIKGLVLSDIPRVYRVEYSKVLHSKVEKALIKLQSGKAQIGTIGDQERKFQSELNGSINNKEDDFIVFSDLPELALPEK